MNRDYLLQKLSTDTRRLNKNKRFGMGIHIDKIKKAFQINKNAPATPNRDLIIALEELSELQKEITKALRFPEEDETANRRVSLEEEIADVYVGLEYIKLHYNLSDEEIHDIIEIKLNRFLRKQ